jgi:hypothetical protein
MNKVELISENLIRIHEIMMKTINESSTGGAPWYIKLIDELGTGLRSAGKQVPTTTLDFLKAKFTNAFSQDEIDDAVKILFNKRSGFYDDLIRLIKNNYSSLINKAIDDIAQYGQDLLDAGMPLNDVHNEMDNFYNLATKNSYLGDDLALEIKLDARNKLRQPQNRSGTNVPPLLTPEEEAKLMEIFNTYKTNKKYQRLFNDFGPQMKAEFDQLKVIFTRNKDFADFSRKLDDAFIKWEKAHPEVPSGFWPNAKILLKKMFIVETKAGNYSPLSIVKMVGWLLAFSWVWRGLVHKAYGESWTRAFFKSTIEDAVGVLGGTIEGGEELIRELVPKPDEPLTPGDIKTAEEKY